jgi:proline dehydrogenase
MEQQSPTVFQKLITAVAYKVANAYYAGPDLADAVQQCQRITNQGLATSIGYWPNLDDTPEVLADAYLAGIDAIAKQGLDSTISIKAMAMDFDRDLIARITDRAGSAGVGIHYDSRAIEMADQTFELVTSFANHKAQIGCTLPAVWPRSLDDTDLVTELGVNIRVVKGMWRDPEHPDIDEYEGFLAVIDRLCGRARHVGVATHHAALAREALKRLIDSGTPCELELLFGLSRREIRRVARDMGVRTRIYIPYGNSWVPYAVSQAFRHPRMLLRLASDMTLGRWSHSLR